MTKRGFDLDDLIVDFNGTICHWFNERYGTTIARKDIFSYHLYEVWGISRDEGIRGVFEFYHSREHAEMSLIPGAAEVIQQLEDSGDEIYVISARPRSVLGHTRELVERHFPKLVGNLYLTNRFGTGPEIPKSALCQRLGIKTFVDDAPHHHQDVARMVDQAILFETPWNREYAATLPQPAKTRSWYSLAMRLI